MLSSALSPLRLSLCHKPLSYSLLACESGCRASYDTDRSGFLCTPGVSAELRLGRPKTDCGLEDVRLLERPKELYVHCGRPHDS